MARIKIALVIDQLIYAGAQKHIVNLATNVNPQKFQLYIICLIQAEESLKNFCEEKGVKVFILGIKKIYGFCAFRKLFTLISFLRKEEIDIVQTYLFSSHIYGTIASVLSGRRIIISCRRTTAFWKKFRYRLCRIFVNFFVRLTVPNSQSVAKFVRSREYIPWKKIVVIPNGVDVKAYSPPQDKKLLKEKNMLSSKFVCITVARLTAIKGIERVIEVARRVVSLSSDFIFLVIGKGVLEGKIKKFMEVDKFLGKVFSFEEHPLKDEKGRPELEGLNPGEKRLIFLGEKTEVKEYLQLADFFLLLSESEGMSNALLEAMACSCCPIISNRGGNVEVIEDGVSGFLVEPADYKFIGDLLISLSKDEERLKRISEQARRRVEKKFPLEKMVSSYEELYLKLIGGKRWKVF